MSYKEFFRKKILKFKSEWKRLGLRKSWFVFVPIAIILPLYWYTEFGLACCLFVIGGACFYHYSNWLFNLIKNFFKGKSG